MYIIGLDFGNFYSLPCIIKDMDNETRRGGTFIELKDPNSPFKNGIPSAFFYSASKNDGKPLIGYRAERARPAKYCVRYMKRHLQGNDVEVLDGKTFTYDEMITQTIQFCLREANKRLNEIFHVTTNLVSLSYPAGISNMEKTRLVKLAEAATLEDGRHVQIVGTIAEPAAAALDYEASLGDKAVEEVVLTYDLGGGTFDLSLTKVYPKGKKRSDGSVYYYDFIATAGDKNLGGLEFDGIMRECIIENAGKNNLTAATMEIIRNGAEHLKCLLTYEEEVNTDIYMDNGNEIPPVKRKDFEKKARPLVEKTIKMMKDMMNNSSYPKPVKIVLCGGASQMPIVKKMIAEAFPEYERKNAIIFHNPSQAIAAGAARFAVLEDFEDDTSGGDNSNAPEVNTDAVQRRTVFDIGVRYYEGENDNTGHITSFISADEAIPCKSEFIRSKAMFDTRYSSFAVYEATTRTPDRNMVERDYTCICSLAYDHGKIVPAGTSHRTRIVIDERGLLHLEVYEADNDKKPPQTFECELKNLK